MSFIKHFLRVAVAVTFFAAAGRAMAADDTTYKPITASDLARSLTKYWATGVAVEDTLVEAPGRARTSVGDRTYFVMELRILGRCYLDVTSRTPVGGFVVGRNYLFTGTVVQEDKGWLRSDVRYTFAATDAANSSPTTAGLAAIFAEDTPGSVDSNNVDVIAVHNIKALVSALQTVTTAAARERGIEMWQMFDPAGTNREFVTLNAYKFVGDLIGQNSRMTPESIITAFVIGLASLQNPRPTAAAAETQTAPAVEPTESTGPKPEVKANAEGPTAKSKSEKKPNSPEPKPEPKPAPAPAITPPPAAPAPEPAPAPRPRLRVTPIIEQAAKPAEEEQPAPVKTETEIAPPAVEERTPASELASEPEVSTDPLPAKVETETAPTDPKSDPAEESNASVPVGR